MNRDALAVFRGWLAPVVCVLSALLLSIGRSLYEDLAVAIGGWSLSTDPNTENYHPLWGAFLCFAVLSKIGLLVFAYFLVKLLVAKSIHVPKLIIVWLVTVTIADLVSFMLLREINPVKLMPLEMKYILFRPSLYCALALIPYFVLSKRVKSTFIS